MHDKHWETRFLVELLNRWSINHCDISGFQVTSFLFINEWFSLKLLCWNYYYLNNFNLFNGLLRKGWWYTNNIKMYMCILIRHVLQQHSLYCVHMICQTISSWSTRFLWNWTLHINKNSTMHIVPFSFCCIYSFLSMFLYFLDSLRATLLGLFFHIKLTILLQIF